MYNLHINNLIGGAVMIIGICTPCRAAKMGDVETRVKLLLGSASGENRIPLGLEVVGPLSDFQTSAEEIVRNVAEAKKQGIERVVIHAPITRNNWREAPTNLSRSESVEILNGVFDIANRIGARLVNAHFETFLTADEMREFTDAKRNQILEKVSDNLRRIKKGTVGLSLENMPWPLMGDSYWCQADMIYEPVSVDPEEVARFALQNGAGLTFDTCHWGTLGLSISLKTAVQRVAHNLVHLHMSDVLGRWIDGSARYKEGVVPGDGDLGQEVFYLLLEYLQDLEDPVTITAEVNDRDFKNPEESRLSLARIFEWLRIILP